MLDLPVEWSVQDDSKRTSFGSLDPNLRLYYHLQSETKNLGHTHLIIFTEERTNVLKRARNSNSIYMWKHRTHVCRVYKPGKYVLCPGLTSAHNVSYLTSVVKFIS